MSELSFRKRGPKWEYRFEAAQIGGKRKQVSKGGFATKKEAAAAGAKAFSEYNNAGLTFEPSEVSVSDYLDHWVMNYCIVNTADSTITGYRNIIKNHIKPRIGHYKLKAITTMILQDLVNDIALNNGFTKLYMQNILKVLKGAFKYAKVTAKLISYNPADDVTLPKFNVSSQKEIIILTKDNVNEILERFHNSHFQYYAMLTAYYTGLRVSEVFGLTWDCIDFESKTLTVNKSAKKIEKEGKVSDGKRQRGIRGKAMTRWYFGDCKTPGSYRTIAIGDTLLNALSKFKCEQEQCEIEYDNLYIKQYLKSELTETNRAVQRLIPMQQLDFDIPLTRAYPIFIRENGEFTGTDSMKYVSKVANHELGIKFNFHAFRHTHATMLIESGVPVNSVAERLGHDNVRTTIETYVHVTNNMRNEAVNKFEERGNLDISNNIVSISDIKKNVKKAK